MTDAVATSIFCESFKGLSLNGVNIEYYTPPKPVNAVKEEAEEGPKPKCEACLEEVVEGIKASCGHVFHSYHCIEHFDYRCPIDRQEITNFSFFKSPENRFALFDIRLGTRSTQKTLKLSVYATRMEILFAILNDGDLQNFLKMRKKDKLYTLDSRARKFWLFISRTQNKEDYLRLNEYETPSEKGFKPGASYYLQLDAQVKNWSNENS